VYRQMFKTLSQSAWPPYLELVDRGELAKAEVLLGRQAPEVASVINDAMLLAGAGYQFQPCSDRAAIALRTGQKHSEIVARPALRSKYRRGEQVAGKGAPCRAQYQQTAVAEQVRAIDAVAFPCQG